MNEVTVCPVKDSPLLKDLDGLLRCGICYEYMKTTMVTSCSHNYCSLCIRKSLIYKPQCPACFEQLFDSHLRNNKIVDEFIQIFLRLLDLLQNQPRNNLHQKGPNESKKKHNLLNIREDTFNTTSEVPKNNKEVLEPVCKPTTSFFTSKIKEKEAKVLSTDDDSSNDGNVTNISRKGSSKQEFQSTSKVEQQIPSMFTPKKARPKDVIEQVNLVPCPVCNVGIPDKNINTHLDACLKRSEMAQGSSSKQVEKRKPLPKLVYSLLQDKEIKKRLKDLGLSNHGDRKTLINRHQRYTLLYNSDCDNSNPRSPAEIIQQVEREEKEEKKIASISTSGMVKIDRKTDPKIIEQVHHQYIQQNKKSFDDLIKQIKNRQAANKTSVKPNRIESDDDDDAGTRKTQDSQTETPDNQITEKKPPLRNCISDDSDDPDAIKSFPDTSDTGKQANTYDTENGIEVMDDMAFESDTDVDTSPVLGRPAGAVPSKTEKQKNGRDHKNDKLTPDMFVTQDDIQIVDSDDGSNDSFSLLSQVETPDIVKKVEEETNETRRKQCHRKVDSQLLDPDFVPPDSEDVSQDFQIKKPTRSKRKAKKTSASFTNPVITGEPRTLRKRPKH